MSNFASSSDNFEVLETFPRFELMELIGNGERFVVNFDWLIFVGIVPDEHFFAADDDELALFLRI